MTPAQKPPEVRKARRFLAPFGKEMSAGYAREYGLTPEAADWLAALNQCDAEDLASALLVLTAMADVGDGAEGEGITPEAVKARIAELRLQVREGDALSLWRAVARDVVAREDGPDV
jgi:hypothetical protein